MCYFKSNSQKVEDIELRYKAKFKDPTQHRPKYRENGFQFPKCAVITMQDPESIDHIRWGLSPPWTRSRQDAFEIRIKTLNARAESIFEKPSFKTAILSKRCLIPATGYFEWMHEGKKKTPYFISLNDAALLSMGGIHESWIDPESGKAIETFSIVTTEANLLTGKIHNTKQRMPLILERADEEKWLDNTLSHSELEKLMRPHADQNMQAWTISDKLLQNAEDSDPKIIEEWVDPAGLQGSLF
ncbi:MAG: SOS response-associated peptidase [Flavobacteriales bacterium]